MDKDPEMSRLLSENQALAEELSQCQADKDFVWSLWKSLQVANPDVTQAISLVVQREKEKAEIKDREVLDILQIKDEKIQELSLALVHRTEERDEFQKKQEDADQKNSQLEEEKNFMKDEMAVLENRVKTLEEEEKHWEIKQSRYEEMFVKDKQDLNKLIEKMKSELEKKDCSCKKEGDPKELDQYRCLIRDYELKIIHHQVELNNKDAELEKVRCDLAKLWENNQELETHSSEQAKLICELQDLQKGTHEVIKNQEKMFSWEASSQQKYYSELQTKYEEAKKSELEFRNKLIIAQQELKKRKQKILELEKKLAIQTERKNVGVQTENIYPENSFRSTDDTSFLYGFPTTKEPKRVSSFATPKKILPTDFTNPESIPLTNTAEPSSAILVNDLQSRVETLDEKLFSIQQLTLLKEEELNEIKSSHDRRLERFRTLQTNYKHLKEQLKIIEEEDLYSKNPRKKLSNQVRAKPKDLQQENCDAVWNELAHFKLQNKNLMWEKLEIQEELDRLRVQHSHNMASLHEMRLALEQEREDHEYFMQMRQEGEKLKVQSELRALRKERSANQAKAKKIEEELQIFHAQRNSLLSEKQCLKTKVAHLKEAIAQYRLDAMNLKHQYNRTQKQLYIQTNIAAKLKKKLECNERVKKSTNLAKQYQKLLNKSIDNMQELFSDFTTEDWQEVSETTSCDAIGTSGKDAETHIPLPLFSSPYPHAQPPTPAPGATSSVAALLSRFQAQTDNDAASSSFSSRISSSGRHIKKVSVRSTKKHQVPRGRMSRSRTKSIPCQPQFQGDQENNKQIKSNISPKENKDNIQGKSPITAQLKDASTSPVSISTLKRISDLGKVPKPVIGNRPLGKISKQKFQDLQRQIVTLRSCRSSAFKSIGELKETVQQLQADLTLANQKLKSVRQHSQKLQERFDKQQEEKTTLTENEKKENAKLEEKNITELQKQISELQQNKKDLETRMKASSNEVSRQVAANKSLRTDNDNLQAQVKTLTSRVSWLERDVSQKRHLIEEQKSKIKFMEDNAKCITDTVESLSQALKQGSESHEKRRVQVDSLKQQLSAAAREKENYERKCKQLSHGLEKKIRQYEESVSKQIKLKLAVTEMEKTAQEHIFSLASESEAAISVSQEKMVEAHNKLEQFNRFIKTLSRELVLRTDQTRAMMKRSEVKKLRQEKPSPLSMQKAKTLAKDILHISDAEMDDIMKADSASAKLERDIEKERDRDQKWLSLCEQTMNSRDNFVVPLIDLFIQKLEEKDQLLSKLNETLQ